MTEPERTTPTPSSRSTRGVRVALVATAVLLVVGVVALVLGLRGSSPDAGASSTVSPSGPPPSAAAPAVPGTPDASGTLGTPSTRRAPATRPPSPDAGGGSAAQAEDSLGASEPTSLTIPSIGVRSRTFVPLSVQRDGTISVPGTADEVGLYDAGPTPGEVGSSVLAAHVDTPDGVPGIFANLRKVRAGDDVTIARRDGSRLTFTVDRVAAYKKTAFPTDLVYKSDFRRAELRLVTCGGPTDNRNEYRDNVIVFAHLSHVA